jgi:flagellin-specific chaperone FliS
MPTYEIQQYELHIMRYRVEAASEAEAIALLFHGEAEPVNQSQEFIQVANELGLPVDQHRDLAQALRKLGVSVDGAVIPSIRSIKQV